MSPAPIEIRSAVPADIPCLVDLLRQLFSIEKDFVFDAEIQHQGLAMMLKENNGDRTIRVACINGQVKGMCSVQTRISTAKAKKCAILEDLVVDESCRGNGIGNALVQGAWAWCRQKGIFHIWLLADKDNTPALNFYRDRNWSFTNLICLTKTIPDTP